MEPTSTSMTLSAIKDFVSDLSSIFGGPQSSALALYNRLIKHVENTDSADGLGKYIMGFRVFFANYEKSLESVESMSSEIPRGTVIRYGDSPKIFIEVQRFIHKANIDQKEAIRQHLLTICAVLDPNDKNLGALDAAAPVLEKMGFGGNSAENRQIQATIDKAKKAMVGFESNDPGEAIAHLMQSGVIGNMISGFKDGLENKTLDPSKLMGTLQNTLMSVFENVNENNENSENNQIDTNEIMLQTQMSLANLDLSSFGSKNKNKIEEVNENEDVD